MSNKRGQNEKTRAMRTKVYELKVTVTVLDEAALKEAAKAAVVGSEVIFRITRATS